VNLHPQNLRLFEMLQAAEWETTLGLIKGPPQYSLRRRRFTLYRPPKRKGFATAPSNRAFDRSLRDRNPNWVCETSKRLRRDGAQEDAAPEDSTPAHGRIAMESAMSRGFAV
jgi:Protein of unknown function (DUF938)